MRLTDLAPLLPIAALIFAPLACSSSASDDSAAQSDGGDQGGDEGGTTTGDGGTTGDSSGPFTPGPHPSYPQVPKNGNAIVTSPRVVAIIPGNETTPSLSGFAAAFMTSDVWTSVAGEYGLGTAQPTVTITGAANLTGSQSESAIQSYIEGYATAGNAPDGHTIYLVFLPSAAYIENDQGCQTQGIGGYHTYFFDNFSTSTDGWAVVQHCTGTAQQGLTETQWATIAASHEIAEAATDVDGQNGYAFASAQGQDPRSFSIWDDVLLTEIGDLCVMTQVNEGAYSYQRMWSNKAAKNGMDPCAPAVTPYFNTGAVGGDTNGWFKTSGGKVDIQLEAFSNAAVADWALAAVVGQSTESGWTGNLTSPRGGSTQHLINNNEKGTLSVSAPAGASSGSYAIFELVSEATTATGGEYVHIWPIGVYVP